MGKIFGKKRSSSSRSKRSSKKTGLLGLPRFSKRFFILTSLVFAVIGSFFVVRVLAVTTSVTYEDSIIAPNTTKTRRLTTGKGQIIATLRSRNRDLSITVLNKAGTVMGTAKLEGDARSTKVSFNGQADTYSFVVNYSGEKTGTVRYRLRVQYELKDTVNPTAVITSPQNVTSVKDSITFSASATDDVAVAKVEFYAGTTLLATDTTSPYSTTWNSTSVANGPIEFLVKSYDSTGNVGVAAVTVTVDNPVPPPTGTCPAGTTGTPPNCVPIPTVCPAGTTGTPPNCVPVSNVEHQTQPVPISDFLPPRNSSGNLEVVTTGYRGSPSGDGTGNFRIVCQYSHMNYDDAIVYPGQAGKAHLHTYFGNVGSNYTSTAQSLRSSGNSTCDGGIANRSSYWAPTLLDSNNKPVGIDYGYIYYKSGYRSVEPNEINDIPAGLKMIAGNGKATVRQSGEIVDWTCENAAPTAVQAIPNCGAGDILLFNITFPQCWNGRDLDSADHQSHMAYPTYGVGCPSSHPVAIPVISLHIRYKQVGSSTAGWKLSSDSYTVSSSQTGGMSAHADFMEAWDPSIRNTFVVNCIRAAKDCGVRPLGDGRELGMSFYF